jgi:hypothetical protein
MLSAVLWFQLRIRIQIVTSMRIWIQGAKPTRIHADADTDPDPGQTFSSQKPAFFT